MYRNSDEPRHTLAELVRNIDAMIHEAQVERLAVQGHPRELARVINIAAGRGFIKDQRAIDRAKTVLNQVLESILNEWLERNP